MGSPSPHNAAAIQGRGLSQQPGQKRRGSGSLAASRQLQQEQQLQQLGLAELKRGQLQLQVEVRNLSIQMEAIVNQLANTKVRRLAVHVRPGD